MSFKRALQTGQFGVKLALPSRLVAKSEDADHVELKEPDQDTHWNVSFSPDVRLDLAEPHRAHLVRALEHYARAMFDGTFAALTHNLPDLKPRTSDPRWSPMVEIKHVEVDGSPALHMLHRMAYEHGREIVMGHLLVPLHQGLFEVRLIGQDIVTGYRESALVFTKSADLRNGSEMPPQAFYDDPKHDESFPQHALSRVRATLHRLEHDAGLEVLTPALPIACGEVELAGLGCALVPPQRFVLSAHASTETEQVMFTRCSFCTTDGLESLLVTREHQRKSVAPAALRTHAEKAVRRIHEESQVSNLKLRVDQRAANDGSVQVLVIAEGTGHLGRLRNSFLWFLDAAGQACYLCICATDAVPAEVHVAELDESARSWRQTSAPPRRKPWWQVF